MVDFSLRGEMDEAKVNAAANAIAEQGDCDVLLLNGDIHPLSGKHLIKTLRTRQHSKNVVLLLVTPGGDPDAAFKIGRALQNAYSRVTVFVPGWCKSAGTLIALAGHDLVIADEGELGPLDIQIAKSDEIMELGSGLTVDAAMKSLEATASKMVLNLMVSIRRDTGGSITTKTAADLAARMVTGLLEPIYRQIDPIKIGENSRAMNITRGYGNRLNLHARNLRTPQSLEFLVSAYPDHSFAIDRKEAEALFHRVAEPNDSFKDLAEALGEESTTPKQRDGLPIVKFLSTEANVKARSIENEPQGSPTGPTRRPRSPNARGNGRAVPAPKNGAG